MASSDTAKIIGENRPNSPFERGQHFGVRYNVHVVRFLSKVIRHRVRLVMARGIIGIAKKNLKPPKM
jgi:hypothetical protein